MEILLCVDPLTRTLYRYDLSGNKVKFEHDLPDSWIAKINEEANELELLRGLETSSLSFRSPECNSYRNRPLSRSLLVPEALNYPSMILNKEISSAFASTNTIRINVCLNQYISSENLHFSDDESYAAFSLSKERIEASDAVSLYLKPEEVVDSLLFKLNKYYEISLSPKNPSNFLCLKVKGRNDYMIGKYAIFTYIAVRQALREDRPVHLTLTEIPIDCSTNFPTYTDWDSPLAEPPDSLLFWYTPDPSPPPKTTLSIDQVTENLLHGQHSTEIGMMSGMCNWPFRVKLIGIERVDIIYEQAFRGFATEGGRNRPDFIVVLNSKDRKQSLSAARSRRRSVPVVKGRNSFIRPSTKTHSINNLTYTAHINHGPNCRVTEDLASTFRLPFSPYVLAFEIAILYGDRAFKKCHTQVKYFPFRYSERVDEWVRFPLKVSELPQEARIGVNVYTLSQSGDSLVIGCASKTLFDANGRLRTGVQALNVWPFYRLEERLVCMQEFWGARETPGDSVGSYCRIFLQFDSFIDREVDFSLKEYSASEVYTRRISSAVGRLSAGRKMSEVSTSNDDTHEDDTALIQRVPSVAELAQLERTLRLDPLTPLSREDRNLLFVCRKHYSSQPLSLQLFLSSVNWQRPLQVQEARRMLACWAPLQPEDALALLHADFPDLAVRTYATTKVAHMCDSDLALYMPQLAQALCAAHAHGSPLAELLVSRALRNPYVVGHQLFWCFRSQLHYKATAERLGLVLERFLLLCGRYRKVLMEEFKITSLCNSFGLVVKQFEKAERSPMLRKLLRESKHTVPEHFTMPVDSSIESRGIGVEHSKVMDSKKRPLSLHLKTAERNAPSIPIIYKIGDDLQQDMLTLQIIKVMDNIWLENGLDLQMKTYKVVATSDQAGMIEVIQGYTTAEIQVKYGGNLGPFRKNTISDYIKLNNEGDVHKAMDNFTRSCAGYCVASFIIGIGDRHNGNIMITKTGHLFHIDFGHFLGNFKKKAGINRERSRFVFTEEMIFVMGGRESTVFKQFKDYCCRAYNLCRKHGKRIINLFRMMVSAGIPELKDNYDIEYLRDRLAFKLTDMEANELFINEINVALNNVYRRIDNWIHINVRK